MMVQEKQIETVILEVEPVGAGEHAENAFVFRVGKIFQQRFPWEFLADAEVEKPRVASVTHTHGIKVVIPPPASGLVKILTADLKS
jgi:hypothetical protein